MGGEGKDCGGRRRGCGDGVVGAWWEVGGVGYGWGVGERVGVVGRREG